MGTTSNYSWPTPEATDLVKDGWEAIKDLGDAADASLKTVADASGLVHINTTSFSAVASQALTNVFSTTYRNYLCLVNITSQTNGRLRFQLGNSGTPVGGTSYATQNLISRSTTVTGSVLSASSVWQIPGEDVTQGWHHIEVFQPFETVSTRFAGFSQSAGGAGMLTNNSAGAYDLTTSFTDFFLLASTGTITGAVSIYGYAKA